MTLTCEVRGLVDTVDVSWKDKDKNVIKDGEGGYIISHGTVKENQVQEATLTISSEKLDQVAASINVHDDAVYSCSVKTGTESVHDSVHDSVHANLKVIFLYFGRFLRFIIFYCFGLLCTKQRHTTFTRMVHIFNDSRAHSFPSLKHRKRNPAKMYYIALVISLDCGYFRYEGTKRGSQIHR